MKKIILIMLMLVFTVSCNYSEGTRSGVLSKLSKKGFILKTWEGTLLLGSGDRVRWDFSVRDKNLAEKLQDLQGSRVKVEYEEDFIEYYYNTKYNIINFSKIE